MPGSHTSEASSNATEPGFATHKRTAAALPANIPQRRPAVEPLPADLSVDGVAFRNVMQLPLVPLRAVLPTGVQLGLIDSEYAVPPVLDGAIEQREGIGTERTGEALKDKYPVDLRRSLRDDAELKGAVVSLNVAAHRHRADVIRKPGINNGRETVVELMIQDDHRGWIIIRQLHEAG